MLNKVSLIGNVGRLPKVALTQEGKPMGFFSLATTHYWKDGFGEWQSATDWHKITVFRASTVEWIKKSLKQGDLVYVEGKLSYHQWSDKFGQDRLTSTVTILEREGWIRRVPNGSQSANLNAQGELENNSLPDNSISDQSDEITAPPLDILQEENPSTHQKRSTQNGETKKPI